MQIPMVCVLLLQRLLYCWGYIGQDCLGRSLLRSNEMRDVHGDLPPGRPAYVVSPGTGRGDRSLISTAQKNMPGGCGVAADFRKRGGRTSTPEYTGSGTGPDVSGFGEKSGRALELAIDGFLHDHHDGRSCVRCRAGRIHAAGG